MAKPKLPGTPIIFSTPMVQKLRLKEKRRTRRLATSPLAKVRVGDWLWVRESFAEYNVTGHNLVRGQAVEQDADCVSYLADEKRPGLRYRPSIHMPRNLNRVTLEVCGWTLERLQEISEHEARLEGCTCREGFRALWDDLHTDQASQWRANPLVIALGFFVHLENIDRLLEFRAEVARTA